MRLFDRSAHHVGLAPGTAIAPAAAPAEPVRLTRFVYNQDLCDEQELTLEGIGGQAPSGRVTWLNVDGVGDADVLRTLGTTFGIHDLVLEDIANPYQRPKVEVHDDFVFMVLKMIDAAPAGEVTSEQVSLVLTKDTVISFQERRGDVFGPLRERIRTATGNVRKRGADYLFYALADAVVDNYFSVMEHIGEQVETLESGLIDNPNTEASGHIHALRREVILLRRAIWPLRDAVNSLLRDGPRLVTKGTLPFLRDLHDHAVLVIDALDSYRDMLSGMRDMYMSAVSNRMNEVMKVLTVISTIFIPLGFLAGLYGMNFTNMPELQWQWGYYGLLGVMAAVALGMVGYFRYRKWL